jgi:hypothetical protein
MSIRSSHPSRSNNIVFVPDAYSTGLLGFLDGIDEDIQIELRLDHMSNLCHPECQWPSEVMFTFMLLLYGDLLLRNLPKYDVLLDSSFGTSYSKRQESNVKDHYLENHSF